MGCSRLETDINLEFVMTVQASAANLAKGSACSVTVHVVVSALSLLLVAGLEQHVRCLYT
jgi:hypothetical protein